MDLSVVIVNWNAAAQLSRCLDSLRDLSDQIDEVVAVDNASEDSSCREARARPFVRLIANGTNRGFASAANQGVSSTRSPFVLLLNADTIVSAQGVRELYTAMEVNPAVAIACGPLTDDKGVGQTCFQFRPLPTPLSVLMEVLGIDSLLRRFGGNRHEVSLPESGGFLAASVQPAAAYWVMSRRAWEDLGGFDEGFWPAWFEDVDYCRRLQERPWRIYYCPSAGATHVGGVSVPRMGWVSFTRAYYRNMCRYLRKHHPWGLVFLWLPIQTGSLLRVLVTPLRRARP